MHPPLQSRLWEWVNRTPPPYGTVWWRKILLRWEARRVLHNWETARKWKDAWHEDV